MLSCSMIQLVQARAGRYIHSSQEALSQAAFYFTHLPIDKDFAKVWQFVYLTRLRADAYHDSNSCAVNPLHGLKAVLIRSQCVL